MTSRGTSAPTAWDPNPAGFGRDLEAKPAALARLGSSRTVRTAVAEVPTAARSICLLGMGSSRYAAEVAARRLRGAGIEAVAEYASTQLLPPPGARRLIVAISASGTSRETVAAASRCRGASPLVAVTEHVDSPLAELADVVVPLEAGAEEGGVASRTFQHSGLVLRLLEAHLASDRLDFEGLCNRVAEATTDLLDRRDEWLEPVAEALDGPDGVHVIAPAERWSSAAQSALMLREGPRRPAAASETGDWNHVDVYLTETTDYRALLLAGSPFDEEVMGSMRARGSSVVAVGADLAGTRHVLRYRRDDDPGVAVHTETLIAELVAARWWLGGDAWHERQAGA